MTTHTLLKPIERAAWTTASAILTLDPASSKDAGLALRATHVLKDVKRGSLPAPRYSVKGNIWNNALLDELGVELGKIVPQGGKIVFAVNATVFGGNHIAFSLGRATGNIEGMLHALNIDYGGKPTQIQDQTWRATELPLVKREVALIDDAKARRVHWKNSARHAVWTLYGIQSTHDEAEAVLLNDHIVLARPDLWRAEP